MRNQCNDAELSGLVIRADYIGMIAPQAGTSMAIGTGKGFLGKLTGVNWTSPAGPCRSPRFSTKWPPVGHRLSAECLPMS